MNNCSCLWNLPCAYREKTIIEMAIANKSIFGLVTTLATNIGANTSSITYKITLMLKLWLYMEPFKFS